MSSTLQPDDEMDKKFLVFTTFLRNLGATVDESLPEHNAIQELKERIGNRQ